MQWRHITSCGLFEFCCLRVNSSEFQAHRGKGALSVPHLLKNTQANSADHLVTALRWHMLVQDINLEHAIPNTINGLLARGSVAQFVPVWWLSSTSLGSIIKQSHPVALGVARLTVMVHNGHLPHRRHTAHTSLGQMHMSLD